MKIHTKPRDWQKRIEAIRRSQNKMFIIELIYAIMLLVGCIYMALCYGNK